MLIHRFLIGKILAEKFSNSNNPGSIKSLLKALDAQAMPMPESAEASFANLNTPEDLHKAL